MPAGDFFYCGVHERCVYGRAREKDRSADLMQPSRQKADILCEDCGRQRVFPARYGDSAAVQYIFGIFILRYRWIFGCDTVDCTPVFV